MRNEATLLLPSIIVSLVLDLLPTFPQSRTINAFVSFLEDEYHSRNFDCSKLAKESFRFAELTLCFFWKSKNVYPPSG
jgi:hypothetical protein